MEKQSKLRSAWIITYGVLLVAFIAAGGAAATALYLAGQNDRVILDYQVRMRSLAAANQQMRTLLGEQLPPMRDTMTQHTDQIGRLTDRVDDIAQRADGAAKAATSAAGTAQAAAKTARQAATTASQAGQHVGRAATQVETVTEKVEAVVEKITPAVPPPPASAPAWLDTP